MDIIDAHAFFENRNVNEEGKVYSAWLDKYAEYALLRLQVFSPDLAELAAVCAETSHAEASSALEKVHISDQAVPYFLCRWLCHDDGVVGVVVRVGACACASCSLVVVQHDDSSRINNPPPFPPPLPVEESS